MITQFFNKNKISTKYLIIPALIIGISILLTISFKNDQKITKKNETISSNSEELETIKKFLLSKINAPFINEEYTVKSGDSIQKILKKFNVKNSDINKIINQYKKFSDPSKLVINNKIGIIIKKNPSGKNNSIVKFNVPISQSIAVEITKNAENIISAKKLVTKLYKKKVIAENLILNNLYTSAVDAKINPEAIIEFARIFGFEIDFQRDIRKEDYFKIVYEKYFDEDGVFVKSGNILYAHMSVNNRKITLYRFGDDKDYSYFDANGNSVEKALMKTPINGARLSSPFGMRKHPILGYNKKHLGTDFAAPSGTPIMASGSGTVLLAKWCGGGGNCVKIKHNSTYQTVYAHMKAFAKGIRAGKKVKQGQIIGYVGSTGMSTGPHLHYEVIVNGKKVNSQTLKLPSGKKLKDNERKLFEIHRIKTDVMVAEMSAKS
tara:strand:+ start:294 stop:1595 length:1302 start_codon:yes stop_codon:yes gene_type:complete